MSSRCRTPQAQAPRRMPRRTAAPRASPCRGSTSAASAPSWTTSVFSANGLTTKVWTVSGMSEGEGRDLAPSSPPCHPELVSGPAFGASPPTQILKQVQDDIFEIWSTRAAPRSGRGDDEAPRWENPCEDVPWNAVWSLTSSAAPRRLDGGDVDLPHGHHGVERALGGGPVGVGDRLRQGDRRDLPGQAPSVLAPAARALLPAVADDRVPVAVCLGLILGPRPETRTPRRG